jgi:general secretion pathway protein L
MKRRLKDRFIDGLRALNAGAVGLAGAGVHVRLPRGWPETDPSVRWWMRNGDSASAGAGRAENLAQLPAAVRSAPVHVWTPPGETLLTRATIPTRSRARILQALPYALEDQLLEEPENLHFAYVREADGSLAVAVTQRARLNIWLDILKGAGLRPASLCPGNLALPLYPQAWSVAFVDDELWVRSGEYDGFISVATLDAPPPVLVAALKEAQARNAPPQRLVLVAPPPTFDVERWGAGLDVPLMVEATDFWQHAKPSALSLLQADFGQGAHLQQLARPLRPAAIMLGVWLVAVVIVDVAEWIRLHHDHSVYTSEMHDIFQRSFPEVKTVLDPALQMQKQLEALQSRGGGPADLLPLLTRIAPALQTQQGRMKLQGIKYTERSLTLEIALPDFQALEAMKSTLQAANLDVEVLAANGRGNEVEGRLKVQPSELKAKPRQRT